MQIAFVNTSDYQQYADLRAFRQTIFSAISKRQNAAFNLLDALLERPYARSIAELSLSPFCPRQWCSLYDAVEEACFDQSALEAEYCRLSVQDWRENGKEQARHYGFSTPCMTVVGDASMVRRSSTQVVDGLRYCHTQSHEVGSRGIVVGHQYQLFRYIADPNTAWALPLSSDRLGENHTAVGLAAEQLKRFSNALPEDIPCLSIWDGGYGCATFAIHTQDQRCGVLARMRHDRILFHAPKAERAKRRGAPKVYGERFDCQNSASWLQPQDYCQFSHPSYGLVCLERWNNLLMPPPSNDKEHRHKRQAPITVDALRCTIHCQNDKPTTIWLMFQSNAVPPEIADNTIALWRGFAARSGIEASIKVSKQECSWTMPQTKTAAAADRWTHITECAFWHLFLARRQPDLVCHPWQKTDAPITPRRVRQSMAAILLAVGTPAAPPRLRGKSLGWQRGRIRAKKQRVPVIYKSRPTAKKAPP